VNRDPIAEQGGVNLYGVMGNRAVSSIDYLGLYDPDDPDYVRTNVRFLTLDTSSIGGSGTISSTRGLNSIAGIAVVSTPLSSLGRFFVMTLMSWDLGAEDYLDHR
jgi:hypothetical protein